VQKNPGTIPGKNSVSISPKAGTIPSPIEGRPKYWFVKKNIYPDLNLSLKVRESTLLKDILCNPHTACITITLISQTIINAGIPIRKNGCGMKQVLGLTLSGEIHYSVLIRSA